MQSEKGERSVKFQRSNGDVESMSCSSYTEEHSAHRPFAQNWETEEIMAGWTDRL